MSKMISRLILIVALICACQCTLGIDVSQLFSVQNFTCAKEAGIKFAIPRGYCSFGGMDKNVVQSLKNMREAGLETDTYMFPCRGKNAAAQVNEMIDNIPGNLYGRIWIDIETNPSAGCSWNDHDGPSNC